MLRRIWDWLLSRGAKDRPRKVISGSVLAILLSGSLLLVDNPSQPPSFSFPKEIQPVSVGISEWITLPFGVKTLLSQSRLVLDPIIETNPSPAIVDRDFEIRLKLDPSRNLSARERALISGYEIRMDITGNSEVKPIDFRKLSPSLELFWIARVPEDEHGTKLIMLSFSRNVTAGNLVAEIGAPLQELSIIIPPDIRPWFLRKWETLLLFCAGIGGLLGLIKFLVWIWTSIWSWIKSRRAKATDIENREEMEKVIQDAVGKPVKSDK